MRPGGVWKLIQWVCASRHEVEALRELFCFCQLFYRTKSPSCFLRSQRRDECLLLIEIYAVQGTEKKNKHKQHKKLIKVFFFFPCYRLSRRRKVLRFCDEQAKVVYSPSASTLHSFFTVRPEIAFPSSSPWAINRYSSEKEPHKSCERPKGNKIKLSSRYWFNYAEYDCLLISGRNHSAESL